MSTWTKYHACVVDVISGVVFVLGGMPMLFIEPLLKLALAVVLTTNRQWTQTMDVFSPHDATGFLIPHTFK